MITVMITGIGSNIGQGIIKALNLSGMESRIIGTDIHPLAAGLFRCHKGYIVPLAGSNGWLEKMVEICTHEHVDMILIGSDGEVPFFSRKKTQIEKRTMATVLVSNLTLVDSFQDKWKTASLLSKYNFYHPKTCLNKPRFLKELKEQVGFPLVVKPKTGCGSHNFFVANNEKQLGGALAYVQDAIIQEYVDGEEFTSGIFFDKSSNVKGTISLKRELKFGTTYRAISSHFKEVDEQMIKFSEILSQHGAIGPFNVQSRYCEGRVYILEINPRFSGTTPLRAFFNFNEVEASLKHFLLNEEIQELNPSTGVAMRYFDELYVSLAQAEQIQESRRIMKPNCIIPKVF